MKIPWLHSSSPIVLAQLALTVFPRSLSHFLNFQSFSPSAGLVNLQFHEIPDVGYFSPEAFGNALSEMTQLETLSLHFVSLPPR